MTKPTVTFEPYTDNIGGEFLIPRTHHDLFKIEDLGLNQFMEMVMDHSLAWNQKSRERFLGLRLSAANLVMLEKLCKIEISQQTIDK
jgi:hypothetical protein